MNEAGKGQPTNVRETLSGLTIAFALAFVFRGFVIEGFVIPTGSMAPTLNGAHVRLHSPESGFGWAINPWEQSRTGQPEPVQGDTTPIDATDPMTGGRVGAQLPAELGRDIPTRGGERIFVFKYLFSVFDPARFDPVVFKFPGNPSENYIKRLVGLPNEEIALVDGDIFRRDAAPLIDGKSDWSDPAWSIVRKPERIQRTLWMPVFDARYEPISPDRDGRTWFRRPWQPVNADGERDTRWTLEPGSYAFEGGQAGTLRWDTSAWPITDRYWYNEVPNGPSNPMGGPFRPGATKLVYPVSDVRLAFNLEARGGGSVGAVLRTRKHEFRARLVGPRAEVAMRAEDAPEWTALGDAPLPAAVGEGAGIVRVEFWFADQRVGVWIDGREILAGDYDWTPADRVRFATSLDPQALASGAIEEPNPLTDWRAYTQPELRMEIDGGAMVLHRLRIDRDLHYQASTFSIREAGRDHSRRGQPALATHPLQPCVLGPDHFFMCGDNAGSSLDGRLWDDPDPWVARQLDPAPGVVHRHLIVGRAFVVYYPGMNRDRGYVVPDAGRVRWIW